MEPTKPQSRNSTSESAVGFALPLTSELVLFVVEAGASAGSPGLTQAEQEVAALAARGLSNNAIARQRGCSPNTVANQLVRVYSKLGLSGRRELRRSLGQRGSQ